MTVSSTSSRVVHTGNGVTTSFPFAFKVKAAADLVVVHTDAAGSDVVLSPAQYGASGFGQDAGGTVTYPLSGSPIAAGTKLTLYRDVAVTQPTQISNQGAMWPAVIEAALDRLTFIAQKIADGLSRALTISPTDGAALQPLPNATQRANSLLGFDAQGQPYAAQISAGLVAASTWLIQNFFPAQHAAAARSALEVSSTADMTTADNLRVLKSILAAKGSTYVASTAATPAELAVGAAGTIPMARPAASVGIAYVAALSKAIHGLTYANNTGDATNDIDIAGGGCMDATGAYWIALAALTKQLDAAWAVGNNQGGLDAGAVSKAITGATQANPGVLTVVGHGWTTGQLLYVTGVSGMTQLNGNTYTITVVDADHFSIGVDASGYSGYTSGGTAHLTADFFVWAIARSDTGATDVLLSRSATAPAMPTGYDFKRLVGWFKRSAGAIVAFTTWERDGGGLSFRYKAPIEDVRLANTIDDTRQLLTLSVPVGLQVEAALGVMMYDTAGFTGARVCCPDETNDDVYYPDGAFATGGTAIRAWNVQAVNASFAGGAALRVRTDTSARVAARCDAGHVANMFVIQTEGFEWSRR